MAHSLYSTYEVSLLTAPPNLLTSTLRMLAIDTTKYTPSLNTDQFASIISNISGAVLCRSGAGGLSGKTATAGGSGGSVFKANNEFLTSVPNGGPTIGAIVLYADTGSDATSPLIMFDSTLSGLPYTPAGQNIIVIFDATNGIFKIG